MQNASMFKINNLVRVLGYMIICGYVTSDASFKTILCSAE